MELFLIVCFCVLFLQDQCDSRSKWMHEYPYEEENNKGWLVRLWNGSENPILNMTLGRYSHLSTSFSEFETAVSTVTHASICKV